MKNRSQLSVWTRLNWKLNRQTSSCLKLQKYRGRKNSKLILLTWAWNISRKTALLAETDNQNRLAIMCLSLRKLSDSYWLRRRWLTKLNCLLKIYWPNEVRWSTANEGPHLNCECRSFLNLIYTIYITIDSQNFERTILRRSKNIIVMSPWMWRK